MTRDDSHQLNELFVDRSRDVTPATLHQAARVLYAPALRDPEASILCASVLSDAELKRADRFSTERDKTSFLQRRAFRRYCGATALESPKPLSQIAFEETENGRPFLPGSSDLWFSFSSCGLGFLGAWSSSHAIGVDLEDQARRLETADLAQRFFCESEADAVEEAGRAERARVFFRFWSLKEAALKSIGEGLPFGLDTFEFELEPDLCVVQAPACHGGPEQFFAHGIDGTDGAAALVLRNLG